MYSLSRRGELDSDDCLFAFPLGIRLELAELPGWDFFVKQFVNLFEIAAGCFGLTKEEIDPAENTGGTENESSLGSQIPLIRIDNVR